jgi:hypothetical protein
MTRKRWIAVVGLGMAAALAWAYTYHNSDVFSSINTNNWHVNGTVSPSGIGLQGVGAGGGAVISKLTGMTEPHHEVKAKIKLATGTGGDFVLFTRASSDAWSWVAGSYYSVEWFNPSCDGAGACWGWIVLYKKLAGQQPVTLSANVAVTYNFTAEIRFVAIGSTLLVWVNDDIAFYIIDSDLTTGNAGVGARSTCSACAIERADIGHLDTAGPNAVDNLTVSRFPSVTRLRWQVPLDNVQAGGTNPGIGVGLYEIYKNGAYLTSLTNTSPQGQTVEWTDPAAPSPTATYTYQVRAIDRHLSYGTATSVTAPPAAVLTTYDARQVGVKALGSYWGAGGESIDLRSGNLNYTMPMVAGQIRGGGKAPVSLSHNTQSWQKLGSTEWRVGKDTGYGFGWRMMLGSVTRVVDGTNPTYYVFADSSGSEYKLNYQNGSRYYSAEGFQATFDDNPGASLPWTMYFNDGSRWEFGCISASGEDDADVRYPTRVTDTNGNYVDVRYGVGVGAVALNTSSRIQAIEDVRAVQVGSEWRTYSFNYGPVPQGESIPHLTSITNHVNSGETYNLYYWPTLSQSPTTVTSPLTGAADSARCGCSPMWRCRSATTSPTRW